MLSLLIKVARKIRSKRMRLKLSQREVARRVACHPSYVAQIETGRCPCSRAMAEKFERLFRVKRGSYTEFNFPRGRPRLGDSTRVAIREIRQARELRVASDLPFLERAPAFPRASRVRALENLFWPLGPHLGEIAARDVKRLELQRGKHDRFWRLANSLRFDSWSERWLVVQVGIRCEELVPLSLGGLGSQLRGVDGETGKDTHYQSRPAFVVCHGGASVAWFPQCCVRSARGYRWPDALLVVARQGRKVTLVVELDGPIYHRDLDRGVARDRELGVEVLHLHPDVLRQRDGLDKVLDWACSKLG